MFTTEVTGHYRLVHNCACQRCVRHLDFAPDLAHHARTTPSPSSSFSRQTDHPAFRDRGCGGGGEQQQQQLWGNDARTLGERGCHRSPQRRPVFVGTSPLRACEVPPVAHCSCDARHCAPRRDKCGCTMVRNDTGGFAVPHALPHVQVRGHRGFSSSSGGGGGKKRPCRTVRYASMEDEDYISDRGSSEPQLSPRMDHLPNGHCGMGTFGVVEAAEDRDTPQKCAHRDWTKAGSTGTFRGLEAAEERDAHRDWTRAGLTGTFGGFEGAEERDTHRDWTRAGSTGTFRGLEASEERDINRDWTRTGTFRGLEAAEERDNHRDWTRAGSTGTFGGLEGAGERDSHRDWTRAGSGAEHHGCNGHGGFYRGFFSTEVPPKHLLGSSRRRNGASVGSSGGTQGPERLNGGARTEPGTEPGTEWGTEPGTEPGTELEAAGGDSGRKETVREQIRQVVADLEGVLGGLKQCHVEMKEVVEQIDRLTANIDLSHEEETLWACTFNNHNLDFPDDSRAAPAPTKNVGEHRPRTARRVDEERIILRTNSPSTIHTASVVKTNRVVPAPKQNGLKNGHPPQLFHSANHTGHVPNHTGHSANHTGHVPNHTGHVPNHTGHVPNHTGHAANHTGHTSNHMGHTSNHMGHTTVNHTGHAAIVPQEPLEPTVIIEGTRTQKPPPYPQNGRCGKHPPRTPPPLLLLKPAAAHSGRGRQSSSAV